MRRFLEDQHLSWESNCWTGAECWLNGLNYLGRSPLVTMMQTSHLWEFNNLFHLAWLNSPGLRSVFGQP
jgi:hypothetical protein